MRCRHCKADLTLELIDLGSAPPSNAYLTKARLQAPEKWFPLRVLVCTGCWLVQTDDYAGAEELFDADYAYFSSYSDSWLRHSEHFVEQMILRFGLNSDSHVIEIAANDGYLLQFVKARNISCLGIEPTASTASAAREKGIKIEQAFFSVNLARKLADEGRQADLAVANNVLAHVPDINNFVAGFAYLLKPEGVATFEFPHLMHLVSQVQFDTIYHEHFSYLSLTAVNRIFELNGLQIFDIEKLSSHGGSLRVFAQRMKTGQQPVSKAVHELLKREDAVGMKTKDYYRGFQQRADEVKYDMLNFLLNARSQGKKVMAYGAAAKGNTLLNYAGIRSDLLSAVIDRNPDKQGKYLPGSRIPIIAESEIKKNKPDYVIILPWNLKDEIKEQLDYINEWGGKFIIVNSRLQIL